MLPWINRQLIASPLKEFFVSNSNIPEKKDLQTPLSNKFTPTKSKIGMGTVHISPTKKQATPRKEFII